jgi:diguanylate cyclase (GGDEF)-like protein
MRLPRATPSQTVVHTLRRRYRPASHTPENHSSEEQNLSGRRLLTHRAATKQGSDPSGVLRSAAAAHSLARALAEANGVQEIGKCVLRHVRRALACRFASMAAPTGGGDLAIVASEGYSHALVQHVRIAAGKGPIGTVFTTGRPLLVRDMAAAAAFHPRRRRFATDSYMVVPVLVGGAVAGIVCVSDPIDGKPFTRRHLGTLRRVIAPAALALALDAVREQSRAHAHAAVIDPVSGLFNRRYFQIRLQEEMQRAGRQGTMVGLLMLDIDNFKGLNDQFGHVVGDTVIRDVAEIVRQSVRRFDVCARFGGDEFVVIMGDADEQRLRAVAERIRRRIDAYRPADGRMSGVATTVSIGVTLTSDRPPQEVVERADQALYAAKNAGKNRVVTSSVTKSWAAPDFPAPVSELQAVQG